MVRAIQIEHTRDIPEEATLLPLAKLAPCFPVAPSAPMGQRNHEPQPAHTGDHGQHLSEPSRTTLYEDCQKGDGKAYSRKFRCQMSRVSRETKSTSATSRPDQRNWATEEDFALIPT